MAFLAKTNPKKRAQMYHEVAVIKEISVVNVRGQITGEDAMSELTEAKLVPNGEKEARLYLEMEQSDKLNLGAKEIAAFQGRVVYRAPILREPRCWDLLHQRCALQEVRLVPKMSQVSYCSGDRK